MVNDSFLIGVGVGAASECAYNARALCFARPAMA